MKNKAKAAKAKKSIIFSFWIRMQYSVSFNVVWVSHLCHSPNCYSSTGCRMKPMESWAGVYVES